jgi:nucleotide-binding universal stress UspA family protein
MQVDTHLPRGPNGARRSSTIVVGYDGSAESRRALAAAASRAGDGGTVVAVYATAPPSDPLDTPFSDRAVERRRDRARRIFGQLAELDPGNMTFEAELADGPAPEPLARVTESRDARRSSSAHGTWAGSTRC